MSKPLKLVWVHDTVICKGSGQALSASQRYFEINLHELKLYLTWCSWKSTRVWIKIIVISVITTEFSMQCRLNPLSTVEFWCQHDVERLHFGSHQDLKQYSKLLHEICFWLLWISNAYRILKIWTDTQLATFTSVPHLKILTTWISL